MKAIESTQYGGPEQLSASDVPKPEAKPGQIVVRVSSACVAAQHKITAFMLNISVSAANLQALAAKIDAGEVRPFVGRTYPLSAAAQAWADVHSQHIEGKVVLTVS